MDRISCLAFLLYQAENEEIQKAALQLVNGEISIKELKNIPQYLPYIREAEKELKKNTLISTWSSGIQRDNNGSDLMINMNTLQWNNMKNTKAMNPKDGSSTWTKST